MFEKEAEEYVDLSGNRNYTERAFKDGAEFGYNKGLEAGRPKWHDMRKNPNDLPSVHSVILNECCDKVNYTGEGKWEVYSEYYEKYVDAETPIAWCELPEFEEEAD